jgi:uncharacterized protein with GYD domain
MARYISLCRWTEAGRRSAGEAPKRAAHAGDLAASLGGSFEIVYTMGQYDFIVLAEFPDDEAMVRFMGAIAKDGNVISETLRAFSREEAERLFN